MYLISSLLHLVGLRPRGVKAPLNQFFLGGGGQGPLGPPQYANDKESVKTISLCPIYEATFTYLFCKYNSIHVQLHIVKLRTKMLGLYITYSHKQDVGEAYE